MLALNVALGLAWIAITGSTTLGNLLLGLALGYATLWLTRPFYGETRYFIRSGRFIKLVGMFVYDLVASSIRVAAAVLSPKPVAQPGIITVPLDADSEMEILLTSNLISLTPGTLTMDAAEDRSHLIVHAMFVDDPEALRTELKTTVERRVLEALR